MDRKNEIPKYVINSIEATKLYFADSFIKHELRFPGWRACLKRYADKYDEIISSNCYSVRQLEEIHNELCVADALLEINYPYIDIIEYEPPILPCLKTIDYKCKAGNIFAYVDIKTITPKAIDAWSKFTDLKGKGLISENNEFILEQEYLGGEFWHDITTSRGRMLEYTIELEKKILESGMDVEGNMFLLALCGNGAKWHVDELEDFVHYYRTGHHRDDDGLAKMESHYMEQNRIVFSGRIDKFIYVERSLGYIQPQRIVWNVVPPNK